MGDAVWSESHICLYQTTCSAIGSRSLSSFLVESRQCVDAAETGLLAKRNASTKWSAFQAISNLTQFACHEPLQCGQILKRAQLLFIRAGAHLVNPLAGEIDRRLHRQQYRLVFDQSVAFHLLTSLHKSFYSLSRSLKLRFLRRIDKLTSSLTEFLSFSSTLPTAFAPLCC